MFILSPSAPNSRDLPRAFYMVSCNFVVAKLKNKTIMNKKTIITALLALVAMTGQAQTFIPVVGDSIDFVIERTVSEGADSVCME